MTFPEREGPDMPEAREASGRSAASSTDGQPGGYPDELIPLSVKQRGKQEIFKSVGQKFVDHLQKLCGLRADERLLEVGSGLGRLAIPLTAYLSDEGSYEGLDVSVPGVEWCRREITPRWPNFRFQLIDVFNERYNPSGAVRAEEYRFPFRDAEFNVAMSAFVFCNLLPDALERYLFEIARVMKPGGRFLANYFLLNSESLGLLEAGRAQEQFQFPHVHPKCRVKEEGVPEMLVAHDEDFVLGLYREAELEISEPIRYGRWCRAGADDSLGVLDLIVAHSDAA